MIQKLAEQLNKEADIKAQKEFDNIFKKDDDVSISILQRKCKLGYNSAVRLFQYLIQQKRISKNNFIYIVS